MLSPQEKRVYDYIKREISENGYSPSVRDIQTALGIKSTSTVHFHLKRLEESGYITKESGKSRTLRLGNEPGRTAESKIPVLGYVRAGSPISAEENFDGYVDFRIPKGYDPENLFALHVEGDSMIEAGILDGDTVIVDRRDYAENGEIVVALVENAATVKVFYKEDGHYRLNPRNKTMQPLILDSVAILGKVIASVRYY